MNTLFFDRQNTESCGWRCELKCKGSNLLCTTRLSTGSLLFLIMIGDIYISVVTAFLSSFSDDTRVGHGVKTMEDL